MNKQAYLDGYLRKEAFGLGPTPMKGFKNSGQRPKSFTGASVEAEGDGKIQPIGGVPAPEIKDPAAPGTGARPTSFKGNAWVTSKLSDNKPFGSAPRGTGFLAPGRRKF